MALWVDASEDPSGDANIEQHPGSISHALFAGCVTDLAYTFALGPTLAAADDADGALEDAADDKGPEEGGASKM